MTKHPEREALRVAGICGSIRKGSYTRMALALALRGAEEAGVQTELIDPRDYRMIFCDGKDDESGYPKDIFKLRGVLRQAQGIILATPEYHSGYSGVLKNALDMMGFEEFEGKMLGLIGVSGGGWAPSEQCTACGMSDAHCTRGSFPSRRVCPKRGRCSTNRATAKTPRRKDGLRKSAGRSYDSRACTPRSKPASSYANLKVP